MFGRRQAGALNRADSAARPAPAALELRPPDAGTGRGQPADHEPTPHCPEITVTEAEQTAKAAQGEAGAARPRPSCDDSVEAIAGRLAPYIRKKIDYGEALRISRANLAIRIIDSIEEACQREGMALAEADVRNVATILIGQTLNEAKRVVEGGGSTAAGAGTSDWSIIETTKQRIQPILLDRIDVSRAVVLPPEELAKQITEVVSEILAEGKLQLNTSEQRDLVTALLNDLLGLGPLEVLLADDTVNDIMVNGPKQVYVERKGKLQLTDVAFRDNSHVMSICTRIVSRIGRASTRPRLSAMHGCRTGRESTSSSRRWRSTDPRSRSASSPSTRSPSKSWSGSRTCRRRWRRC